MKPSIFISLLLLAGSLLLLTSCGDNSLGGGVGEFNTVTVTAVPATVRLESDVVTGNTCSDIGSTGGTFKTDTVKVTIKSTAYQGILNPMVIALDKYTVKFTPVGANTPALDSITGSMIGNQVSATSPLTIDIPVATDGLKVKLVNEKGLTLCSTKIYEYFATITFDALELGTGQRKSIETSLNIAFADRTGTQ
jgi:hypothetical protein